MRILLQQLVDRFVYGLFYPAILGANIVLIIEAWSGALKGHLWEIGMPWAMMLVLFVFDYVVTAPFETPGPPYGSVELSLLDGITAALFLVIHIKFGLAAKSGILDALCWWWVWFVFWMLHVSCLMWCIMSMISAKHRFSDNPPKEKVIKYKKLLLVIIVEIVFQGLLILIVLGMATTLVPSIKTYAQFNIAASIAIVGWFIRRITTQFYYDKYRLWEDC